MKKLLFIILATLSISVNAGPLHDAAKNGDLNAVQELLAARHEVNEKDGDDYTPLHLAAYWGHLEVANCLIQNGADLNAKNNNGNVTSLHFAVFNGHLEVAKFLIQSGADAYKRDDDGNTPLEMADERIKKDLEAFINEWEAIQEIKEPGCK